MSLGPYSPPELILRDVHSLHAFLRPHHIPAFPYVMLLPLQPLAQALAAMLKRAEPPICVGLYARWGSGKTFMISLLKKEFDPDVREEPRTRRLLQFFEEGYDDLGSTEQEPADESITYLICYLLLNILLSLLLIPRAIWLSLPYGA